MAPSFVEFSCLAATIVLLASTSVRSEDSGVSKTSLRGLTTESFPQKRPRIIGGQEAEQNRFPYYSIMNGDSLCGAVLISPRFVLSAGHCQDADRDFVIGPKTFDSGVAVGYVDRAVHPLYNENTYNNDIALFKLEKDATLITSTGTVVPAPYLRLSPEEIFSDGFQMTVIGFGDVDPTEDTEFSFDLRHADVGYVSNNECRRDHRGEITEEMMCAEAPGKDACYGDSGGPLLLTPTEDPNDDRLVGIVSWGRGCADENYPGVYTRISYFYDWIIGTMCVMGPEHVPPYVDCNQILGLAPSDNQEIVDIRDEDLIVALSETPTETPSAAPVSPTETPTAAAPICGGRGTVCSNNKECCSGRCNFFAKVCYPKAGGTRVKLSSGFGGSGGGSVERVKSAFVGFPW